jgi:hypothetical protein
VHASFAPRVESGDLLDQYAVTLSRTRLFTPAAKKLPLTLSTGRGRRNVTKRSQERWPPNGQVPEQNRAT